MHPLNPFHSWPFAILTQQSKHILQEKKQKKKRFPKGTEVPKSQTLFFLESGTIALHKKEESSFVFHHTISAGNLIGFRESLLKIEVNEKIIAQTDIIIQSWDSKTIIELIRQEPQFAQAVSRGLKKKHDLFGGITQFIFALKTAQRKGFINVENLIENYKKMSPALHPFARNQNKIDFGAWSYAQNRLPQDLLQTHIYLISTEIPTLLDPLSSSFSSVETRHRRRTIKKLNMGKSLVLVRDMHTDLIDFVSNLCVHTIEAKKLRRLLHKHNILNKLGDTTSNIENLLERTLNDDWTRFKMLWPTKTIETLRALSIHHEDYILYIEKNEKHHSDDSTERWISNIRSQCIDIGIDIESSTIDIISSNRFVVQHCLSPFIHMHRKEITKWGTQYCSHINPELFQNKTDFVYAILSYYLEAHPHKKEEFQKKFDGFYTCNEHSSTGIPVDIIHPETLNISLIDPALNARRQKNHIIINIDYAFGKQAEDILCALISLFHKNIASINIMGKAGALMGKRGDILLAHQVVLANREVAYPMLNSRIDECNPFLKNIHKGSVLTVDGTLLQNKPLLHYFQHFWSCVGLEMEGSFYARQIQQAIHRNCLKKDIETNFLYFVSDLPMQEGAQLSKDMEPHESIPPLYGILRAFIQNIFSRSTPP